MLPPQKAEGTCEWGAVSTWTRAIALFLNKLADSMVELAKQCEWLTADPVHRESGHVGGVWLLLSIPKWNGENSGRLIPCCPSCLTTVYLVFHWFYSEELHCYPCSVLFINNGEKFVSSNTQLICCTSILLQSHMLLLEFREFNLKYYVCAGIRKQCNIEWILRTKHFEIQNIKCKCGTICFQVSGRLSKLMINYSSYLLVYFQKKFLASAFRFFFTLNMEQ